MTDPSARITLVTSLPASPGCCAICGKSEHAIGFAATDNLDFEFYGTFYLCADCIGDYARLVGYRSPSELDALLTELNDQRNELKVLRTAVVHLENTVDAITSLGDFRRDNIIPGDRTGHLLAPALQAADSDAEVVTGSGEPEVVAVDELSGEPRPYDVRDITSTESIDELLAL